MTEKECKDLQQVFFDLSDEYNKALENKYVFKPISYALYRVWEKWDKKEHNRLEEGGVNE